MTLEDALLLEDGLHFDIPEKIYFALPYCSSSYLRKLFNPASSQVKTEETEAMSLGSAVHTMVLEGGNKFNETYAIIPDIPEHKNSNIYKSKYAEFLLANPGKQLITPDMAETVIACTHAIMEHPVVKKRRFFVDGRPEVTVIFTDEETGLRCKARIDRLPGKGIPAAIDLKTTADATRQGFLRSIVKYGYHIQAGHYIKALRAVGIEADAFIVVAVCTKAPHLVSAGMLHADFLALGMSEAQRLLQIEAECRQLGFWPNIELPAHMPSLLEIYNADGSVRNDADLFDCYECPKWLV